MSVQKMERLVNLTIMLLETPRPISAREIQQTIPGYDQENFISFKRMFERDKQALRELGMPVEMSTDTWGEEIVYRIPKERYYLPEVELEADEVAALWLAASLLKLQDPGTARAALLKLSGDITPPPAAAPAGPLSVDFSLSAPGLTTAFAAVCERKTVSFVYEGKEGAKTREVDPYGLLHRRGFWYLIGLDHSSNEQRSFRLDRLGGPVRVLEPSSQKPDFEVPDQFNPEAVLDTPPFAGGDGERARIRFDPSEAWLVERENPWMDLEWVDNGFAQAEVTIGDPEGLLSWIFWYTDKAVIESPQWLRELAASRLRAICA